VAHPHTQFWRDLKPLLQTWIEAGEQILIGLDANEQVNHPEVTKYFNSVGMTEVILHCHGQDVPQPINVARRPLTESLSPQLGFWVILAAI